VGKKLDSSESKNLPKTQAEAIRKGERYFFTGQPCKNGHISQRVLQKKSNKLKNECYECISIRSQKYRATNKEKMAAFNAKRRSVEYRLEENKKRRDKYESNKEQRDYVRSLRYKSNYGINIEEYEELFKSQSGKCAICRKPSETINSSRRLAVDHDHKTGSVRGLLCSDCNTMLGHFDDDPKLCIKAATYIKKAGDYRDNEYLKRKLRGRKALT
jgi:hypothetical protein